MKPMVFLSGLIAALAVVQTALAQPPLYSPRPEVRPGETRAAEVVQVASAATAVDRALRPKLRSAAAKGQAEAAMQMATSRAGFDQWVQGFMPRAQAQGIRRQTLDSAFRGVRFDEDVIRRDRNQSEFSKTIWDYLSSAASNTRIANGARAASIVDNLHRRR